jgi:WD40 repeat protein
MAWRLHLSDRPIRRLDILSGKPLILAAWTQNSRVSYLDLQSGSPRGDRTIEDVSSSDRRGEAWQAFVQTLTAPNDVFLPYVRTKQVAISISADGRMRLYQSSPTDLFLEIDGKESKLAIDGDTSFIAMCMDRSLGLLAALDLDAKLHIYQQHIRVDTFETGLTVDEQFRPTLTMSQDGTALFLTDGRSIVVMDSAGRVRKRLDLHYTLGAMNCSPDGKRFVTSDLDANVIRIYDGSLTPTHQRFAVDLLVEAKRAQLLPSPGMSSAALGPLAINNKGVLAFALSGLLCVTNLAKMKAYPKATDQAK